MRIGEEMLECSVTVRQWIARCFQSSIQSHWCYA